MTKYIVSGYIGFDNFGDEAIAKVLTDYLKQNKAEKITYISSNPQKTAKLYEIDTVGMFNFLPALIKSDVLISGGGSLLQDITSLRSLIYYLLIILAALVFRKKVLIFAQGFTQFRTKLGERLTFTILKHCHEITVRDKKSQEYLKKNGIASKLISDPVFALKTPLCEKKEIVGIQLRDCQNLTNSFLENLADEIVKKFSSKEIRIISLQDNIDLGIALKFKEMLYARNIQAKIENNLTIDKTIELISVLEYIIAMRFHACLVASKLSVKVLGINYDNKVEKLANEIGFSTIELNGSNIAEGFESLINTLPESYTIPEFDFDDITLLNSPRGY